MDHPLLVYSKNRSSISHSLCPHSNRKTHIFNVCTNLLYFDFNRWNVNENSRLSLCNPLSTTCYSSTLVFLSANVSTFDDCLCLFDGRLNQLSQLIINIHSINTSAFTIDNTVSNFVFNGRLIRFENHLFFFCSKSYLT